MLTEFNRLFTLIIADTDPLKIECFKLRYKAFFLENKLMKNENNHFSMEFDKTDLRSVHYLVKNKASGKYAATIRIILFDKNKEESFPIEKICNINANKLPDVVDMLRFAEISRICVLNEFKRGSDDEPRNFPHLLLLALMACCIKTSMDHNLDYLYCVTDKNLYRFCNRIGMNLVTVGDPVKFSNGPPRFPNLIVIDDMLNGLSNKSPEVANFFTGIINQLGADSHE